MQPTTESAKLDSATSTATTNVATIDNAVDRFLCELESEIGSANFAHWFRDKIVCQCEGEQISIGVGSPFLLNWMQRKFRGAAATSAQSVLGPAGRVTFHVDSTSEVNWDTEPFTSPSKQTLAKQTLDTTPAKVTATSSFAARSNRASDANGKQTLRRGQNATSTNVIQAGLAQRRRYAELSEFVTGTSNELARTAAEHVCEMPGERYSPLYIHGGVGIGKTHLLEGMHRRLARCFPSLQLMFLTAEAFTNYFTQALRDHTLPGFRQRFRNVDILLVDDVEFLAGKKVIQEEFLHTIKQLEQRGRQIVITADRHPRLMPRTSDELASRYMSGLVCRIESPDPQTRLEILQRKAARLEVDFAPDALKYVAQRFPHNVRELEGALNCLETYGVMKRKKVSLSAARKVLADLERDCIRIVRINDVEQAVCELFHIDATEMKSPKRNRTVARPRMLAMFLARKLTHAAYSEIGDYFGGRNHSTVMSAERQVKRWLDENEPLQIAGSQWSLPDLLDSLETQLQAC